MFKKLFTISCTTFLSTQGLCADVTKKIIAEFDPIAPASAISAPEQNNTAASKWGGNVDFNIGGKFSVGPEIWIGNYKVTGPESGETYRREDFLPGEQHKLDATRLRWNFTAWERPSSMQGWYVKGGYSYLRINSRANRFTESTLDPNSEDATVIEDLFTGFPGDETDLITDIRHGIHLGFGNRWTFNSKFTLTLGTSMTRNFKRAVTVDSSDPNARRDYDSLIEDLPESRLTVSVMPEANLALGYAW